MATKKTIAKKAPKTKRPPKQVWITFNAETGEPCSARKMMVRAKKESEHTPHILVAGPYVLAERARNR